MMNSGHHQCVGTLMMGSLGEAPIVVTWCSKSGIISVSETR